MTAKLAGAHLVNHWGAVRLSAPCAKAQVISHVSELADGPNNSFKPTPHRGVGHVPALR